MAMKLDHKSEWLVLDKPLAEPNEKWSGNHKYHIQRVVKNDGSIIWFGLSINWKKEPGGNWTELAINHAAKPLEKYLPQIVYGENRTHWKECDTPIYEKLYIELQNSQ
jgi:hypothetical protein